MGDRFAKGTLMFTSGGGNWNNKEPGEEPPVWVGCLFIITFLVIVAVVVS